MPLDELFSTGSIGCVAGLPGVSTVHCLIHTAWYPASSNLIEHDLLEAAGATRASSRSGRDLFFFLMSRLGFRDMRFHPHSLVSPGTHLPPWPPGSFLEFLPHRSFGGSPRSIGQRREIKRKSTLAIDNDGRTLSFPMGAESNFSLLRRTKGSAYFDRTKYISVLESAESSVIVFLRPRRFGKSLTLRMLEGACGACGALLVMRSMRAVHEM
jgi:hypothetical protein